MQEETPFWAYMQVADYDVPCAQPGDAARGGFVRLWKSLQDVFHRQQKASNEEIQWDRLPADVLNSASPELEWTQAATVLAAELDEDWFNQQQPCRPVRAVVGPPGCEIAEVLRLLARERQLNVLTAPSPETLLDNANSDVTTLLGVNETGGEIFVIPELERWYFRHADGLTLVRNLIEQLLGSRARALIGCDSWAWAFLQRAIGIEDLLGEPQTTAPFDAERIDTWFRASSSIQRYDFRQTGQDNPVFPERQDIDKSEKEQPKGEISSLIKSLAATARGNPGVALAVWRDSLRSRDKDEDESAFQGDARGSVLWVVSPVEMAAHLPVDFDRTHRFILHSILLHRGLSLQSLFKLLPFSRDEIQCRIVALQSAGIVEEKEDRLEVRLGAYPRVRQYLLGEGFLTDAF